VIHVNNLKTLAAAFAALSSLALSTTASAADPQPSHGHYEWRQGPQFGPRAPLTAPRRIWVNDEPTAPAEIAPADAMPTHGGHYEWRAVPQAGPRAPLRAPRRVWVPDRQTAGNQADMELPAPRN
jgi:hypothetical protein